MILVSPTEHIIQPLIQVPYRINPLPEANGVDFIAITKGAFIGYQRKTYADLRASLMDGRLHRELGQIVSSRILNSAFLVVEGNGEYTIDGDDLSSGVSHSTLAALIAKCHVLGVGFLPSRSPGETLGTILSTSSYLASNRAPFLSRPGPAKDAWGRVTSREWSLYLLQSFPSIGPKLAAAIIDTLGVPLQWTVTESTLMTVPGIGKTTAQALVKALAKPQTPS